MGMNIIMKTPTKAKIELRNYLKKDLHFKNIKIDIESSDKITDNKQLAKNGKNTF